MEGRACQSSFSSSLQVPQSNGFQEWGAPLDGEIGNNQNCPLFLACMASGHGRSRDILS